MLNIVIKQSLDSTNNFICELISKNDTQAKEGLVVMAIEQTAGRGQRGNSWHSQANKNLCFSLLLEPSCQASEHFLLNMAVSLGICTTLKELGFAAKIKWPNDIYIANKKVCGILIENNIFNSEIKSSIVGVGLNVNQEAFPQNLPNPTSLFLENKKKIDLNFTLDKILKNIFLYYENFKINRNNFLMEEYLKNLYLFEKIAKYQNLTGEIFDGKIISVALDGKISLQKNDNSVEKFYFKEIIFKA